MRVETYIITIIIVSPVRQASNLQLFYSQVVRLVIMYVEIFRTNVIVYIMWYTDNIMWQVQRIFLKLLINKHNNGSMLKKIQIHNLSHKIWNSDFVICTHNPPITALYIINLVFWLVYFSSSSTKLTLKNFNDLELKWKILFFK